jgi:DNA topoisomerase IB
MSSKLARIATLVSLQYLHVAKYKNKEKVKTKDGDEMTVYEYGPRQIQRRHQEKAERLEKLRSSIGDLRKKVFKDLSCDDPETCAVALAVALMDHTYERVGNAQSAQDGHFGVTGWQVSHVRLRGDTATLTYVGKSGVEQEKKVTDKRIVKALKKAIQGKDPEEEIVTSSAEEVNEYLKDFDITAKDLRGFHANEEMRTRLKKIRAEGDPLPKSKKEREKILKEDFKQALEEAAEVVGHEPATLRGQYLVPALEDTFMKDGEVIAALDS